MENSIMEVDEIKSERHDAKLPFSIDNLLADKFKECKSNDCEPSTSAVISDLKSNFTGEVTDNVDSDDDRCSNSSENVDVESSTVGDAQEYLDIKTAEFGQSGIFYGYFINTLAEPHGVTCGTTTTASNTAGRIL